MTRLPITFRPTPHLRASGENEGATAYRVFSHGLYHGIVFQRRITIERRAPGSRVVTRRWTSPRWHWSWAKRWDAVGAGVASVSTRQRAAEHLVSPVGDLHNIYLCGPDAPAGSAVTYIKGGKTAERKDGRWYWVGGVEFTPMASSVADDHMKQLWGHDTCAAFGLFAPDEGVAREDITGWWTRADEPWDVFAWVNDKKLRGVLDHESGEVLWADGVRTSFRERKPHRVAPNAWANLEAARAAK